MKRMLTEVIWDDGIEIVLVETVLFYGLLKVT